MAVPLLHKWARFIKGVLSSMEMGSLLGLQIQAKIDCSQNRWKVKTMRAGKWWPRGYPRPLSVYPITWPWTNGHHGSLDICLSFRLPLGTETNSDSQASILCHFPTHLGKEMHPKTDKRRDSSWWKTSQNPGVSRLSKPERAFKDNLQPCTEGVFC